MPRLVDYSPKWVDLGSRKGLGFLFLCTTGHCNGYCVTLFKNPLDGGPAFDGDSWTLLDELLKTEGLIGEGVGHLTRGCGTYRWNRVGGDSFNTLTLDPSINAHECGHFTLKNGGW